MNRYILILIITFLLVLIANSVQAQMIVIDEMSKVQFVSFKLYLITQGMIEAAILPVGISSSVKILRHVVLNNV